MKCYCKDYPRPQFVRKDWTNLNGKWRFAFDDENRGEKEGWYRGLQTDQEILVPFTYETKMSGIEDTSRHGYVWYERVIEAKADKMKNHRYIIHFEGSDFKTSLWVNGNYIGCHEGAYERFSFDITLQLEDGKNSIVVKTEDSFNTDNPRGKQRWQEKSFGCWYVQTTGIWKTVWSEYVPEIHLESVKMTPDLGNQAIDLIYDTVAKDDDFQENLELETRVSFEEQLIAQNTVRILRSETKVSINLFYNRGTGMEWGIRKWSPERPDLYDIEFRLKKNGTVIDEVGSYFAMREISIDGSNILLNGMPLYQRLVLDQGYWKDSHLTPPSEEALIEDIDKLQMLGYNGVRKHQKTEDERFLYWCDVKGVLVWSEMASAYEYSDRSVLQFTKEWLAIVKQNYNHPSIIVWTPFNESWGIGEIKTRRDEQNFTEGIYHLTKSLDSQRPVIVNDGWEHTVSDILTLHDYEEAGEILKKRYIEHKDEILNGHLAHNGCNMALADGYVYRGQPVIISEFGGIAFDNDQNGWGYGRKVASKEEFLKRFESITMAMKQLPYVCGFCYTQLTDVQQEINGLMDIERDFKVDPNLICEINKREAF